MPTDDEASGGAPAEPELVDGVPTDEVVALLSVPPDEFVSARTARVKELKSAGEKDLAAAVGKLRKPSRGVWVVGEVARRDPELAAEVVDAAEGAETAMSGLTPGSGPPDLRSALEELRTAVGRAASAGAAVDRATDRPAVELALREILSDPGARRAWAGGWLLVMPSESSAPPDELAPRRARREAERAAAAGQRGGARGPERDEPPEVPKETAAERRARKAEEAARLAARRERERALRKAGKALADAGDLLAQAAAAHDDALAEQEEIEHRLSELQAEVESARQRTSGSATDLEAAQARADEARAALTALEEHEHDDEDDEDDD